MRPLNPVRKGNFPLMASRPIEIFHDHPRLSVEKNRLIQCVRQMDSSPFPIPSGSLSIAFVDDGTLSRLHHTFLNDPTPTDVMTFPGEPGSDQAGEIVVSVEHALASAPLHGQTFNEEVYLYLVHGWLHLAGWNDQAPAQRKAMRKAESALLSLLSPLPATFDWNPNAP